jgi:hypothetical protein
VLEDPVALLIDLRGGTPDERRGHPQTELLAADAVRRDVGPHQHGAAPVSAERQLRDQTADQSLPGRYGGGGPFANLSGLRHLSFRTDTEPVLTLELAARRQRRERLV